MTRVRGIRYSCAGCCKNPRLPVAIVSAVRRAGAEERVSVCRQYWPVLDAIGGEALKLGLGLEHHAMAQHGWYGTLHVVRYEVVAAIEGCGCLRDKHDADSSARACAEQKCGPLARAASKRQDVAVEFGLDADGVHLGARRGEQPLRDGRDGYIVEQARARAGVVTLENSQFVGLTGINHANLHEEAVELSFG